MTRSHPALADLHGAWHRTLVREADGSTDDASAIWLQGPPLFADLRQPPGLAGLVGGSHPKDLDRPQLLALCGQKAFAGTLVQDGDAFSWVRRIDLHPPAPLPDAGTLRWDGAVLVEEGLHEAYLEHWELIEGSPDGGPAGALLDDPLEGRTAVLVRVGTWFGYARDRSVPLRTPLAPLVEQVLGCGRRAEAAALLDCEVSIGRVRADRWEIVRSTLPHRVGVQLEPRLNPAGDRLRIRDPDPQGRSRPRDWHVSGVQGTVRLLG